MYNSTKQPPTTRAAGAITLPTATTQGRADASWEDGARDARSFSSTSIKRSTVGWLNRLLVGGRHDLHVFAGRLGDHEILGRRPRWDVERVVNRVENLLPLTPERDLLAIEAGDPDQVLARVDAGVGLFRR